MPTCKNITIADAVLLTQYDYSVMSSRAGGGETIADREY